MTTKSLEAAEKEALEIAKLNHHANFVLWFQGMVEPCKGQNKEIEEAKETIKKLKNRFSENELDSFHRLYWYTNLPFRKRLFKKRPRLLRT